MTRMLYPVVLLGITASVLCLPACEKPSPQTQLAPTTTSAREGYELPIPMREYWAGTTVLKYEYEMRYSPAGRVERNGWSRAYYSSGSVEREGPYLNGERSGTWTFYTLDGAVDRVENRDDGAPWTAPGQLVPTPGTEP